MCVGEGSGKEVNIPNFHNKNVSSFFFFFEICLYLLVSD